MLYLLPHPHPSLPHSPLNPPCPFPFPIQQYLACLLPPPFVPTFPHSHSTIFGVAFQCHTVMSWCVVTASLSNEKGIFLWCLLTCQQGHDVIKLRVSCARSEVPNSRDWIHTPWLGYSHSINWFESRCKHKSTWHSIACNWSSFCELVYS